MYCVECGTQLPQDSNFCLKCGAKQQQSPRSSSVEFCKLEIKDDMGLSDIPKYRWWEAICDDKVIASTKKIKWPFWLTASSAAYQKVGEEVSKANLRLVEHLSNRGWEIVKTNDRGQVLLMQRKRNAGS